VPLLVSEYGWSSYAAEPEVDMPAALFNAAFLAGFLADGGGAAYFYGLEPEVPIGEAKECATRGNLTLFIAGDEREIVAKVPAYYGARLVTTEWLAPSGVHEIDRVDGGDARLQAWAVRRPDGSRSMLIINMDAAEPRRVRVDGATSMWQYAARDYVWDANLERPSRNVPPHFEKVNGEMDVPPWSITVVALR